MAVHQETQRPDWACWAQALGTTLASNGMETCRRCCGGHGYSLQSGLPTLFTSYVQNATWEGDNNVLFLQVRMHCVQSRWCARESGCQCSSAGG